jgi:hypothetical protein
MRHNHLSARIAISNLCAMGRLHIRPTINSAIVDMGNFISGLFYAASNYEMPSFSFHLNMVLLDFSLESDHTGGLPPFKPV